MVIKNILLFAFTICVLYSNNVYENTNTSALINLRTNNTLENNNPFLPSTLFGSLAGIGSGLLFGLTTAYVGNAVYGHTLGFGGIGFAALTFSCGYGLGYLIGSSVVTYSMLSDHHTYSSFSLYLWDLLGTTIGIGIPVSTIFLSSVVRQEWLTVTSIIISLILPSMLGVLGYNIGYMIEKGQGITINTIFENDSKNIKCICLLVIKY